MLLRHLAAGFHESDLVLGFNTAFSDGEDAPPFIDQGLPGLAAEFTTPGPGEACLGVDVNLVGTGLAILMAALCTNIFFETVSSVEDKF
jgi:hypothetical protein